MNATDAAARLIELRRTGRIQPDLPDELRPADLAEAYAVQDLVVAGISQPNSTTIGYKCACTSVIAQEALDIDRPLFGQLLSHTTSPSGSVLDADRFTHRVIEAEVGFRMAADVPERPGGHTIDSIVDYIDVAMPSIEIVDYRYEHWSVGALSVAADNAIHGWWIHGDEVADWRRIDLAALPVRAVRNGEVVTSGTGSNALGHPLAVMALLADELPRYGRRLRSGDLVTTGVVTDVFEVDPGDHVTAEFDGLGTVEVSFSGPRA